MTCSFATTLQLALMSCIYSQCFLCLLLNQYPYNNLLLYLLLFILLISLSIKLTFSAQANTWWEPFISSPKLVSCIFLMAYKYHRIYFMDMGHFWLIPAPFQENQYLHESSWISSAFFEVKTSLGALSKTFVGIELDWGVTLGSVTLVRVKSTRATAIWIGDRYMR